MKLLIAPDKFKGTLTARQAAEAIQRGWLSARPEDETELLPMSDGGDGFGEILGQMLGGELQSVQTVDAAHRPCAAAWWWLPVSETAIIESARIIGLALLPPGEYHPFQLDTFGLGTVLEAAAKKGARHCVVGVGGSATNDGGFGMARALGWEFLDAQGEPIESWTDLPQLSQIRRSKALSLPQEITVAVDVQNPLLGPAGSTRIYGPQKGLRPEQFEVAERCLSQLAEIVQEQLTLEQRVERGAKIPPELEPGAGAAGGLAYGLRCFAGAKFEPGFGLFSRYAHLPERIESAELVITGEGAIDRSTVMGKGVGEIAVLCRKYHVPCIGLAGVLVDTEQTAPVFTHLYSMAPSLTSVQEAMAEASKWLERLAAEASGMTNDQ